MRAGSIPALLPFQPTLPLRGATRSRRHLRHGQRVSTHAPLAGSDYVSLRVRPSASSFQPTLPLRGATLDFLFGQNLSFLVSTHAPLAGSDMSSPYWVVGRHTFQPTLPLRGATTCCAASASWTHSFNPRSPCGERLLSATWPSKGSTSFNPRSPCGERLLHLVNVALRAYHMHDVFHPNASSDELRPSETNQKAVRTSQGIPDSPQFAPPIIPTAYS